MTPEEMNFESAARQMVELANQIADENPDADIWDIADGLLAGAVHYWLYSRQPCEDPMCEDCAPVSTAELRQAALEKLIRQFSEESDYYHAPTDTKAAWA
ncbi:MAG TPA: hypothetical protein VFX47_07840 [Gammaproteobacteria bacterium]|nr:hypothetical protein [Gammaproteobacteria bacterium]